MFCFCQRMYIFMSDKAKFARISREASFHTVTVLFSKELEHKSKIKPIVMTRVALDTTMTHHRESSSCDTVACVATAVAPPPSKRGGGGKTRLAMVSQSAYVLPCLHQRALVRGVA